MIGDPYKVLGLEQDASADDIKKAYRLMAKKYHPDLHPDDPDIHEKMNAINEAYDMLTNPNKYAAKRAQEAATQEAQSDFEVVAEKQSAAVKQTVPRPAVQPDDSNEIQQVVELLNGNRFKEAIAVLTQIPSTGRNARWYYLNALANLMLGNDRPATEYIQKAAQLDPQNELYMQLLFQFQQAEQAYGKKPGGFPIALLIPIAAVVGFLLGRIFLGQ